MTNRLRPTTFGLILMVMLTAATAGTAITNVGSAPPGEQTILAWKHESGDELVYEQAFSSEVDMAGQGTAVQEVISTLRWRVLDVAANGDATIEATTERIQARMDGPMGVESIDSASDEAPTNPQMGMLASQAGTSYTMVVGPNGELRSMEGIVEMRQRMIEALPAEQRASVGQMLDQTFTEDSMKSMFQQGFQGFPEEAVAPGDSWDRSFSMSIPMLGTMTTNVTSTLDGIEERDGVSIAVLSLSGTIQMTGGDQSGPAGMMDLRDAVLVGTVEFDVDRGAMLRNNTSTTMEMAVNAGGQQMTMGVTSTVNMELVQESR